VEETDVGDPKERKEEKKKERKKERNFQNGK
jgi:hypothetical protein